MKFKNRLAVLLGCLASTALLLAGPAAAQTYPTKPVTMVVPYPAGGPSDFVARQIQNDMARSLGQPIVVENLGGVAGALGVQKVLGAPPDGHAVLLGSPMELIIAPLGLASVKYKPEDVKMVGLMSRAPLVLLARKDLPAGSVDEVVALAAKPGAKELTIANSGPGSMFHLVAEKFAQQTGAKFLHVPYKGTTPAMTDLLGGQVDMMFTIFGGSVPAMIAEGKVKALGITARAPLAGFPGVAALAAHPRLAGFEFDSWAGIQVPRRTPEAVAERLNKAVAEAMHNPQVRRAFEATGNMAADPASVAELDRTYQAEIARYRAIAKSINLAPQ